MVSQTHELQNTIDRHTREHNIELSRKKLNYPNVSNIWIFFF